MEYTKQPNHEPIPGYRLIEPLGQGGFGEVWKCEAPGGLFKAIKFVHGNLNVHDASRAMAQQEFNALQRVKGINHPFILSMDRIEVIDGELVIVMELADRSLHELLAEHRQQAQAGIPREELLEYLCEASEALDLMNLKYGLQHLDIKPGNLFLVSNHVKVADFGLVNDLVGTSANSSAATAQLAGITPLYASPEAFMGRISRYSDQYSLAIVFQELLTGTVPFDGKNARQLAMQHAMAPPKLDALWEIDRPILTKALAKDPLQRYPSCLTMMLALITGQVQPQQAATPDRMTAAKVIRCLRSGGMGISHSEMSLPKMATGVVESPFRGGVNIPRPMEKASDGAAAPTAKVTPTGDTVSTGRASEPMPGVSESLPAGYKYLSDLGRSPLGDLWLVQAPNGNRRLVKVILDFRSQNPPAEQKAIAQIKRLRHPALARLDFIQIDQGRLLVGMELIEDSLNQRFETYREQGAIGIPRDELLIYLRQIAVALDDLYEQTNIQHLGLNPRNLLITDDGVIMADFGILHLLGDSMGQPVANLNPRYAAPELAENRPSRSSDQYSLAIIFQEMLTGTRPFRDRSLRLAGPPGRGKRHDSPAPELEMLPAPDRDIVTRALERDPRLRFDTCLEFIDALEGGGIVEVSSEFTVPDVVPQPGEVEAGSSGPITTPHSVKLPTAPTSALAAALLAEIVRNAAGDWEIYELGGMRCLYRPGEMLIHKCGASSYASGMAKGKLEGFAHDWSAELIRNQEDMVVYSLALPGGSFLGWGKKPTLEISVKLLRPRVQAARLTEVTTTFRPIDCKPEQALQALTRVSRKLLESIRTYLSVPLERRSAERLPYDQPIYVSPVYQTGAVDKPVQGQGKDICLGGIGFFTPIDFPMNQPLLLHLNSPRPDGGPANIPGKVVRSQACGSGWYEIGVKLMID
jgi:serine/threonine protein kinase